MERFDFDKLGVEEGKCNVDMNIIRFGRANIVETIKEVKEVKKVKKVKADKAVKVRVVDKEFVYPEDLELKGWTVLTDTNGGQNKVRLFKKCDIVDENRFKRGEPWIRRKEVEKWINKVNGMKKMGGFNSNGWTKFGLNKKIFKEVGKDKMMMLFVKERIFSLRK